MEQQGQGKFSFFPLLIFLPSLIMTVIFFILMNGYSMNAKEAEQMQTEATAMARAAEDMNYVENFYMLPGGQSIAITNQQDRIYLTEWEPQSKKLLNAYPLASDSFHEVLVSYQNDGIVLVTKGDVKNLEDLKAGESNDVLHFYYYEFGKEPVKLETSLIKNDAFLSQAVLVFEQSIYAIGKNSDGDIVAATVEDANVKTLNLSQMGQFKNLVDTGFHLQSPMDFYYPILKLDMYDNTNYIMGLVQNETGQYPIYNSRDSGGNKEAQKNLLAPFIHVNKPVVRTLDNQIVQFNIEQSHIRSKVQTPKEIFYPKKFHLSKDQIAIIGKSSLNNDAQAIGYIYDYSGSQLLFDLSVYTRDNPKLFSDYDSLEFQIQLIDGILYSSSKQQANAIDLSQQTIMAADRSQYNEHLTAKENELLTQLEQLLTEGKKFSLQKILSFVKNDEAGLTIGIIALSFSIAPIMLIAIPLIMAIRKQNKITAAYKNGGEQCVAFITSIQQTGTYINEQPQVKMSVEFTFKQQKITGKVKAIADLLAPPHVGDVIDIVYDPSKNKVYLV